MPDRRTDLEADHVDPVAANRALWDARTPVHVRSTFYDVEGFKASPTPLDRLVRTALGDVAGQRLLHLQCHFGLDTIRLARMGAAAVTGLDFSPVAVAAARSLAADLGTEVTFVEADVLDADLGQRFDVVFTSWGALVWLPDLDRWAATVARHLEPDGRLVVVEQHSSFWPWDDRPGAEPYTPVYPYFTGGEPLRFQEPGTYTDGGDDLCLPEYLWNHPPSAVVTAVAGGGLRVERLVEHPQLVWQALPWLERDDEGFWRAPGDPLPLSYTLVARV